MHERVIKRNAANTTNWRQNETRCRWVEKNGLERTDMKESWRMWSCNTMMIIAIGNELRPAKQQLMQRAKERMNDPE